MKIFTRLSVGLSFLCLVGTVHLSAQEKNRPGSDGITQEEISNVIIHHQVRADRPLIGIYADSHEQGIEVDNIVEGGGAGMAGLQAGDVITAINGTALRNLHDLQNELSKYEGGQQVAIQYLREGQSLQADVTLKARPNIRSDRPLIGIFPENNDGRGVRVDDISAGGGAVEAGIRSGDVITRIDGADIHTMTDLKAELSKHEAGDRVSVQYLRNGQDRQTQVTLKERTDGDQARERDPCAVFIGVSLGGQGREGQGVHVSEVIEDTPAKKFGVLGGDDILALDAVSVNTFNELLHERNKHQPNDFFTLTVLRNGQMIDIEAQFQSCEEELPAEEEVEDIRQGIFIDNSLKVEQWKAFPNPAFGNLNVQFQAEALPTTVQIINGSGQSIYLETLNQFDGYYNQRINLTDIPPGTYYLQVRQQDKVVTQKIVVMPRA